MFDLIIKIEIEIERSFGTDRKKRNGTVSFHIQSRCLRKKDPLRCVRPISSRRVVSDKAETLAIK